MFKVLKTAKFPVNQFKGQGSPDGRYKYAQKLTADFYNSVKDEFGTYDVKLSKIKKLYLKLLPPQKRIEVSGLGNNINATGRVMIGSNKKGNVEGYFVQIKPNAITKALSLQEFGTLMHETDHLFSYFTNPKYTQRVIEMTIKGYRNKKYHQFFDKELQSAKKQNRKDLIPVLTKKLEKYFKNKTNDEKINTLQDFRYRLINERNAYNTGNFYQNAIEEYHPNVLSQKTEPINTKKFYFDEKIELISKMLKNTIQEERAKLSKR